MKEHNSLTTTDKETYYKEPQSTFIIAIKDLNKFQDTCTTYEIQPTSIFTTAEEATYATFNTGIAIDDLRMRYVVQGCLNRLFNSYKSVRTFRTALKDEFNQQATLQIEEGRTYLQREDVKVELDVLYLIYVACFNVNTKATEGNGSKDLNSFLNAININMDSLHLIKFNPFSKLTFSCDDYKYIYRQSHECVSLEFNITSTDLMQYLNGNTATLASDTKRISIPTIKTPTWDESIKIESLIANDAVCMLLRELYSGSSKLSLAELRHLAKSLCNLKGAQEAIKKALKGTGLYNDNTPDLIAYLMSSYRINGYTPFPPLCESCCTFYGECYNDIGIKAKHIKDTFIQKHRTIRSINSKKRIYKDKETVRTELYERFKDDCDSDDRSIYVFKSFVGIGKTQMYLSKIQDFITQHKTVIIGVPSHKLKDDIVTRLKSMYDNDFIENNIIIVPELPTKDINFKECLSSFYEVGDYSGAKEYIKQYAEALGEDEAKLKESLEEYIRIVSTLKNKELTARKIIFTTHERLFSLKNINPDIVIIDEDIANSILKTESVPIGELYSIRSLIKSLIDKGEDDTDITTVLARVNKILNPLKEYDMIKSLTGDVKNKLKTRNTLIREVSNDRNKYFKNKVVDLLVNNSIYIMVKKISDDDNQEEVKYIYRRPLPFKNCKIFIMSATADEEIYKQIIGDIVYREFAIPKLEASITMVHDYYYSKEWFKKKHKNLEDHTIYLKALRDRKISSTEKKFIPRIKKRQPLIITFKEYEDNFKSLGFDTTMHFGNTTGIDSYKGIDIAIFGTYNLDPTTYTLLTKAIYPEVAINKIPAYRDVLVKNKDYSFYMYTSKEFSEYRKIQLWKIESETIQALGRCRPIDNNCLIRIYSNIPPSGFKITFI